MMRLVTGLVLLSMVGCGPGRERCDNERDDDGDGYIDCADQECWASCSEQCGNGVDDDGDGLADCSDPDCSGSCSGSGSGGEVCDNGVDDDGDWLTDCMDPDCRIQCDADGDGHDAEAMGGNDCDDSDPTVHPTAEEVVYDGADNDCDPVTPDDDLDGDGVGIDADCDDRSSVTYPGAPETCGDQVVNDCGASADPERESCYGSRSLATADAVLLGTAAEDWTGYSVAGAGDVNLDGFSDLIIGAYGEGSNRTGAAYMVFGPVSGDFDLSQAAAKFTGESEDDWAGFSVATGGDLTGNGISNMVIGARYDDATGHNAGAVYVVRANVSGTVSLDMAASRIVAAGEYDSAGYSVAGVGDVDGDGSDDLLIGALFNVHDSVGGGAVHLVAGPVEREMELSQVAYKVYGEVSGDNLGCAVAAAGDVDGDGLRDLLFGACLDDQTAESAGAAYLFTTHTPSDRPASSADATLLGEALGDQLGAALAGGGDVDGDGLDDIVVAAPYADGAVADVGAAYLVTASTGPLTPDATMLGASTGDAAGTSVAVLGDVNGDGFADVAVGAPGHDGAAEDAGAAYVLFGPLAQSIDLATEAEVRLTGRDAFDFAGQSVGAAGDIDGDGFADLVVGAPFHDGSAPSGGAAYILTFGW